MEEGESFSVLGSLRGRKIISWNWGNRDSMRNGNGFKNFISASKAMTYIVQLLTSQLERGGEERFQE